MTEQQAANLSKGAPYRFKSGKTAAEMGRKGGIKFGENNAKRKVITEAILAELNEDDIKTIARNWIERAKTRRQDATDLADRIDGKPTERKEIEADVAADVAVDIEALREDIIRQMLDGKDA